MLSACILPLSAYIISLLSRLSIAINSPALGRTSSACPSESLSWTFSAHFLNVVCALPGRCLHASSRCLRTSLPHRHSPLAQLTNALTQRTHAAFCRRDGSVRERQLAPGAHFLPLSVHTLLSVHIHFAHILSAITRIYLHSYSTFSFPQTNPYSFLSFFNQPLNKHVPITRHVDDALQTLNGGIY